jgi:hypothetical protein
MPHFSLNPPLSTALRQAADRSSDAAMTSSSDLARKRDLRQ